MKGMLAAALLLSASGALAEVKVFQNFSLIDGTGKAPVADAALVITDGRITYAGPKSRMKAPAGAQVTDLSGKYIMPGIINLHCHLGNVVGLTQDPKNFTRENLRENLTTYASYGVTAVQSMGSDQDLVYDLRAEQRAGRPAMTRIFSAGRGFTGKAGYPTAAPGMKGVPYELDSVEDVTKAINDLAPKNPDIVKIWVDDHLGRERKIPMDLSGEIIRQAHARKLRVAAHIYYLEDARGLVERGLDALAHSVRDKPVDENFIALMKKRGAWQMAATLAREFSTFTYASRPAWLDDPFFTRSVDKQTIATLKSDEYVNRMKADPDLKHYQPMLEMAQKNLKRLVDAGVKFAFGTDTGPPARFLGYFEHLEMELMVQAGLTPMQVITAATRNSAEFLGAKDLGTLEAGKWADLIVLGKNPLDDIKNSRTIEAVYIAGNKAN